MQPGWLVGYCAFDQIIITNRDSSTHKQATDPAKAGFFLPVRAVVL